MRIMVTSDTHGDFQSLFEALSRQPSAEVVIHLGDGEEDVMRAHPLFPEKMFLQVKGNCDFGSQLPVTGDFSVLGKSIFYTHGHLYEVKLHDYALISAARDRKADIVLYGHTHTAENRYQDGLYIMNPGSLRGYGGTYGVIDITGKGILTNIIKI